MGSKLWRYILWFFITTNVCGLGVLLANNCASQSILTLIGDRCVTNTSSAIGAIYDVSVVNGTGLLHPDEVTYVDENTDVVATTNWIKYHSFQKVLDIDNLIIDQRWEDFLLHSTQFVDKASSPLQFHLVGKIPATDFQIPFSVQIEQNAQVLLCNGTGTVISSHCFWFILSGFEDYLEQIFFLGFRTCKPGEVPKYHHQKILGLCNSSTEKVKMRYELSSTNWTHFKIVKTESFIGVIDMNGNSLFRKSMNFEQFHPTRVFIHSRFVNGFWKIHDFEYRFTDKVNQVIKLEPPEKEACYSMYVYMCTGCYLEIVGQNIELYNNQQTWQRQEFCIKEHPNQFIWLLTRTFEHIYKTFWAARDLKILKSNLRYIKPAILSWKKACQHLESGSILDDSKGASVLSPSCKVDEFGEDCFSCGQIFKQSCPEVKYCFLTSLLQTQCVCPVGRTGLDCDKNCSSTRYGPGCQNDCGHCRDGCYPKNGICKSASCDNNYSGEKCDQPSAFFIFHNSPIIEEGYEKVVVSMSDFQGDGNVEKIQFYVFQYKPVDSQSWNTTQKLPFGQTVEIKLEGLHKQTEYNLRVFGVDHNFDKDKQSFVLHEVKTYHFSTKCDVLKRSDISLEAGSTYVKVIVNNTYLCQRPVLNLMIDKVVMKSIQKKVVYKISTLKPFTNYTLEASQFNVSMNITFQTLAGKPGEPQNLTVSWTNDNSLIITWYHPIAANGVLTGFAIIVKVGSYIVTETPYNLTSEEDYQPFYSHTIPESAFVFPAQYTVEVFSSNHVGKSKISANATRSYDLLKFIIKNGEKFIAATMIVVLLMSLVLMAVVGFCCGQTIKIHALELTDGLCTPERRPGAVEAHPMATEPKIMDRNKVVSCEKIIPGVPGFKTKHSRRIKIDNLQDYVNMAINSGELDEQHGLFPRGKTRSWSYGDLEENKLKNRHWNVVAYDHSRVILNKLGDDPYSDYINANYIDGYRNPKAYIATQDPKSITVVDFWRMIWQEKVSYIVMMSKVMENYKYWPESGDVVYGDYQITLRESEPHVFFDVHRLEIRYKMTQIRDVVQMQFKAWPDPGIPLYTHSLVTFLQRLLTLKSTDFPILVHCSSGVGPTGAVILCDILLRMAAAEGYIDPLSMFEHLRSQRPNMVDNSLQYKFVHLVIVDFLTAMNTSMRLHEVVNWMVRVNVEEQFDYINDCLWQDTCLDVSKFSDPSDAFIIENRYIVTRYPNSINNTDLWRLVIGNDIDVIVFLDDIDQEFLTPISKTLQVSILNTTLTTFYKVHNLEVEWQLLKMPQKQEVQALQFDGWHHGQLPEKEEFIDGFLKFVEAVITYGRSSDKVLICCLDGVFASGIFLTMTFLIEQMKLEERCDVCKAVRRVRHRRDNFINSEKQFAFLYRCCCQFIKKRDHPF